MAGHYFATHSIPEELATDGGLTYMAHEKFLADYGVRHRLSSVAFAQSNKRAELGVKSMKRLIRENTNRDGSLTNDRFLQALMTYRNTPDRDTSLSPAQVIFGRNLRDFLPSPQTRLKPQPEWVQLREDREKALAKRAITNMERLDRNTRALPRLAVGDSVLVQNQVGNHPSKWDITGVVVEAREHDQYVIRVDGSGRMTLRNRKFLKRITPFSMTKHFKPSDEFIPKSQQNPAAEPQPETAAAPAPELPPAPVLVEEPAPVVEPPQPPSPAPVSQPPEPTVAPEPAKPEPRRSSRPSKASERLQLSWGTKSYVQAVKTDPRSLVIKDSLHPSDPRGGGGITEYGCTVKQQQPRRPGQK